MKKTFLLCLSISLIAIAIFVSCNKNEDECISCQNSNWENLKLKIGKNNYTVRAYEKNNEDIAFYGYFSSNNLTPLLIDLNLKLDNIASLAIFTTDEMSKSKEIKLENIHSIIYYELTKFKTFRLKIIKPINGKLTIDNSIEFKTNIVSTNDLIDYVNIQENTNIRSILLFTDFSKFTKHKY